MINFHFVFLFVEFFDCGTEKKMEKTYLQYMPPSMQVPQTQEPPCCTTTRREQDTECAVQSQNGFRVSFFVQSAFNISFLGYRIIIIRAQARRTLLCGWNEVCTQCPFSLRSCPQSYLFLSRVLLLLSLVAVAIGGFNFTEPLPGFTQPI
jgi:hypothetical protein